MSLNLGSAYLLNQPQHRATFAGLIYVASFDSAFSRHPCGRGFTYRTPTGRTLKCARTRHRIESLVIPPAWQQVRIHPEPKAHLQVIGTDAAGRQQSIYHPIWSEISNLAKFARLAEFGAVLPKIRRRIQRDLRNSQDRQSRILAAIVRLLDRGHLRIGNRRYTQTNGSRGAVTLLNRHVEIEGEEIQLHFPGKSGQQRNVDLRDKRLAKLLRRCLQTEGSHLFQCPDERGNYRPVRSRQVADYLLEISNDIASPKDFRTWWASAEACSLLGELDFELPDSKLKREVNRAVKAVAAGLGNTPAVCRASYIHPGLLRLATERKLSELIARSPVLQPRLMTLAEATLLATLPKLPLPALLS